MCGIAGILHFDNSRQVAQDSLRAMCDSIIHRGPDSDGYYTEENVGLGHRRLSIIDLNTGDQPMFSQERDVSIVFNGEIYNYVELRSELKKKGCTFHTDSDTEVIINAY
ncbi:MAG TPA: asparagine synthetase B, partial [Flavobacteriales bacterium]|nr:asparagine synthetase B [Flavobacteriales bacterium]